MEKAKFLYSLRGKYYFIKIDIVPIPNNHLIFNLTFDQLKSNNNHIAHNNINL